MKLNEIVMSTLLRKTDEQASVSALKRKLENGGVKATFDELEQKLSRSGERSKFDIAVMWI
jgi:hypothetical protein